MWFETATDTLFCGDATGLVRSLARVSNVAASRPGASAAAVPQPDVRFAAGEAGEVAEAFEAPPAAAAGAGAATWTLKWPGGRVEVGAAGGTLVPSFALPGVGALAPCFVAPWAVSADARVRDLPLVVRQLRGEHSCVPLGHARP